MPECELLWDVIDESRHFNAFFIDKNKETNLKKSATLKTTQSSTQAFNQPQ